MANELTKVTDQNGVDHPFKDVAAFPRSEQAVLGAKNIWPISIAYLKQVNTFGTWSGNTYTYNDATYACDVDSAGYVTKVTVNKTNSASDSNLYLWMSGVPSWLKSNTDYIMNGCPSGGSSSTFFLQYNNWTEGASYQKDDTGSGITLRRIEDSTTQRFRIYVAKNNAVTNAVFTPMIRLATDTDPTYTRYAMTNEELTDKVQGIINAATNAADFAAFKTAIGNL